MGLYLFVFSGGAPWLGAGVASGILGRAYAWPWLLVAVTHFALCLLYVAIIAMAIYRLSIWFAAVAGTLIAGGIYLITFPIFATALHASFFTGMLSVPS